MSWAVNEMVWIASGTQQGLAPGAAVSLVAGAMALCFCLQVLTPDGHGKNRAKWGLLKNIQTALQTRF